MGLFRIGRSQRELLEEIDLKNKTENMDSILKEWKEKISKPLSDRELLEEIFRQVYIIRIKLESL